MGFLYRSDRSAANVLPTASHAPKLKKLNSAMKLLDLGVNMITAMVI